MKKSTIWILTIVMAFSFIGLLYVQIMYMENIVKMRNEQFSEIVKRSLYGVSTSLEQDETKHFLEEDFNEADNGFYNHSSSGKNEFEYSITSPDGTSDYKIQGNWETIKVEPKNETNLEDINDRYKSMQETLKGQYLYQKGLLNEVILNILSKSSNRPISERADSAVVNEYLKDELSNNGLNLDFEFAVVDRSGNDIYKTSGFYTDETTAVYSQVLFPNDPVNKMTYLKVFFPKKSDYIFSSIRFMIPSFAFTFILLVVFLFTIIIAFRQKKLSEMKNDFINNMTHEFKTPISTISLAAQMLNDDSVRKSPTMLQHISGVINDETKRLRFQVEKVLQMSLLDRQNATLKLQELDVNATIANVEHTYKLKVEKFGGKISTALDAEDSIVNVDEMHFTNVIFNLLDNALKYRREDIPLELSISTRNIGEDKVEIIIADNGIGIKKEDQKKIFEKFFRVSTGNRHDVKGFGLGLAYVHKLITQFKGSIHVESELNTGSKFIIILPLIK
ncbi:MAG: HAMP domain-containing histidine kinase [Muribaculaceae bacterium]|nr:HAMP domain-containing histidine kinase [Muribaculaceae bacterium]MEE1298152.1 HAMP domain-containing sensor histidine kinase [Muribaculaceae bacterium]